MDKACVLEMRNKLVAPSIALEMLNRHEFVPEDFINLSLKEIRTAIELLEECDV